VLKITTVCVARMPYTSCNVHPNRPKWISNPMYMGFYRNSLWASKTRMRLKKLVECFFNSYIFFSTRTSFVAVPANLQLHQNSYESSANTYESLKNSNGFTDFRQLIRVKNTCITSHVYPFFEQRGRKGKIVLHCANTLDQQELQTDLCK
jgi:hypothetical protein